MARTRGYTFDANLEMKDAGLVAASAAATVDGSAKVLDLGGTTSTEGVMVVDISAIEVADGDEVYTIGLQASNSASFASGNVTLTEMRFGDSSVNGKSADDTVGRYLLPFITVADDTEYRYLRVYTTVAGTVATGINYTAWISKNC
jgi:hypothetical protein